LRGEGEKHQQTMKTEMRNFKKLPAWKKGMEIVVKVYEVGQPLIDTEKHGYADMMYHAAIDIPSSIAIGSSYESDSEYRTFLRKALGACFQLETLLIVTEKQEMIDPLDQEILSELIEDEKKLLMNFMRQLIWRGA